MGEGRKEPMKLMKFMMSLVLLVLLLWPSVAAAQEEYRAVGVDVDGGLLDVQAYLVDGRTMVPLRAIFERLSATVEWNDEEKKVTAVKGKTIVSLWIGKTEAYSEDRSVTLDVPPMLINGSTYVPLRFVSESLGAAVSFDSETYTAVVSTNNGCAQGGGQVHTGMISPGGETWGVCGSPHFVKGEFIVEGKDSPILMVEAGAVIRFENNASIRVGAAAPGGLVAEGTMEKPIVFTADTAGAQPGFWYGIQFYGQTLKGRAVMEHVRVEYAGGPYGAVGIISDTSPVELTIRHSEWKHSLYAGIYMEGAAKLSTTSTNLRINGTKASSDGGGVPIMTGVNGTDRLPEGEYTGNDADVVRIYTNSSQDTINRNISWRNIGVPYRVGVSIAVEGTANPTLIIEPGVVTQWERDTWMFVGRSDRGGLVAAGTKEMPITFTGENKRPGSWEGLLIGVQADSDNLKIQHAVIEFALRGVYLDGDMGPFLTDSIMRSNKEFGVVVYTGGIEEALSTDYEAGFGNTYQNNGVDVGIQ
jgi:hypothetical protein